VWQSELEVKRARLSIDRVSVTCEPLSTVMQEVRALALLRLLCSQAAIPLLLPMATIATSTRVKGREALF
jgi:hypothetical protein